MYLRHNFVEIRWFREEISSSRVKLVFFEANRRRTGAKQNIFYTSLSSRSLVAILEKTNNLGKNRKQ